MVSDASSGPPQLREEDEQRCRCQRKSNLCVGKIGCLCPVSAPAAAAMARDGCKKRRVGEEQHIEHSSVLVDTATSPLFGYSKACFGAALYLCNLGYSHGTTSIAGSLQRQQLLLLPNEAHQCFGLHSELLICSY